MLAAGGAAVGGLALPSVADAFEALEFVVAGGRDLSGWDQALGDGLWSDPDSRQPSERDIARRDLGTHSEIIGNVHRRGVMAHAIAFKRLFDMPSFATQHNGSAEFRIPQVPTTADWLTYNMQTLEAGLFVWDGPNTRLDYGVAVQWILNPWIREFGDLRVWTQDDDGPAWVTVGHLEPDTEWHTVEMQYRPDGHGTFLRVDGDDLPVNETFTEKHDDWGRTIDGRFQLEVVSCWPGRHPKIAPGRAEFRNWEWSIV